MTSKFDQWLTTDPRDSEPEYDPERFYVAHVETYDAEGNLRNISTQPIEEWERLMQVNLEGELLFSHITLHFADGSEMNVSRDGGPWGDGSNRPAPEWWHEDDDPRFVALCNTCLEERCICPEDLAAELEGEARLAQYDDDPSPYGGTYSED